MDIDQTLSILMTALIILLNVTGFPTQRGSNSRPTHVISNSIDIKRHTI